METMPFKKRMQLFLLCGILGCIFMGCSDWLMIYGDTAADGQLAWLTRGAAGIAPWRNSLALALAFPAVLFYGIALLGNRYLIRRQHTQQIYCYLTALGLTPWLCIHLLYTMILYLFAWLHNNGYQNIACAVGEAAFYQYAWVIPAGEVLMVLPFAYLFYLFVTGRTVFPRWMALNNPVLILAVLKAVTMLMPDVPFRLAFTNGLMSESMVIWFLIFLIALYRLPKDNRR